MNKHYFFFLTVFLISTASLAQVSGINQLEESTPAALGGELPACTDPSACNYDEFAVVSDNSLCTYEGIFSLNVDNLTNVGNGDVVVRVQDLQGGGIAAQVDMTNTQNADYPVCVLNGCYTFKIVANGANVGFVATLTINGEVLPVTYNNQYVSFGDGNCIEGCSIPDACNYDPAVNILDYSSCVFIQPGFDCDGNCLTSTIDESTLAALSPFEFSEADCATYNGIGNPINLTAFANDGNYNFVTDNNGVYENTGQSGTYTINNSCLVNYQGTQYTFDATTNELRSIEQADYYYYYYGSTCYVGLSLAPSSPGCTDPTACNFDSEALSDDGSCEFLSCVGCTIEAACNYSPSATVPDYESCEFQSCLGCTYQDAENYNASATIDDGSCTYEACVTCMGDFNSDGFINSGDLVVFLGIYGGSCE